MNPHQELSENAVKLLAHIFHKMFCPSDPQITPQNKYSVLPVYFLSWLHNNLPLLDPAELCTAAGVDYTVWEFVKDLVESPVGVERLMPVWHPICLADRPPNKCTLNSFTFTLQLNFDDGRIQPIQCHVTRDMLDDGEKLDDKTVAMIMTRNVQQMIEPIIATGLDAQHENAEDYGGEHPFNVLMGSFLKIIPQLDPSLHVHLKKYMRLCQFVIQPPIPPDVKAAIARRVERNRAQAAGTAPPARGGFDC